LKFVLPNVPTKYEIKNLSHTVIYIYITANVEHPGILGNINNINCLNIFYIACAYDIDRTSEKFIKLPFYCR